MKEKKNSIALVLALLFGSFNLYAQTAVRGVVKDANTGQTLQFVSVYFTGGKGVTTDADGNYRLVSANAKHTVVQFSYVGYKTITKTIIFGKEQVIDINLERAEEKNNVTVKTNKRGKEYNGAYTRSLHDKKRGAISPLMDCFRSIANLMLLKQFS